MFKTYAMEKNTDAKKMSEQAKSIFLDAVADAYLRYICINEFDSDDVMSEDEVIVLTYEQGAHSNYLGVGQEEDATPVTLGNTKTLARITYQDIAYDMMFALDNIGVADEDCWVFAEDACKKWNDSIDAAFLN